PWYSSRVADGARAIVVTVRDDAGRIGVGPRSVNIQNGVLPRFDNAVDDRTNAVRSAAGERALTELNRASEYGIRSISGAADGPASRGRLRGRVRRVRDGAAAPGQRLSHAPQSPLHP